MSGTAFAAALYLGTAVVAVWLVVLYPRAAPSSLAIRAAAPVASSVALRYLTVDASDRAHLLASVFLVVFPVLVAAWVSAVWVLLALRDLAHG